MAEVPRQARQQRGQSHAASTALLLSSDWLPQAILRSVTQQIPALCVHPELLCFPLL